MANLKLAPLAAVIALAIACGDTVINVPTAPTIANTATPPTSTKATIEFRAAGNPTSVRLRYSTPDDGVVQTITALPYAAAFSTAADSAFLSFEATPLVSTSTNPFFTIEIVVNGSVFRQATSADLLLSTLQVSGTWRR